MAPHLVRAHSTYNIWICSFHPPPRPHTNTRTTGDGLAQWEGKTWDWHTLYKYMHYWLAQWEKKQNKTETHDRSVCSRQNFDVMNREQRCATAPSPTLTIVLFWPTLRLWRQNADSVSRSWFGWDIGHFLCHGRGVSGGWGHICYFFIIWILLCVQTLTYMSRTMVSVLAACSSDVQEYQVRSVTHLNICTGQLHG